MSGSGIPSPVRALLLQHLSTVDHVALLLALRAADRALTVSEAAHRATIDEDVAGRVLSELEHSGLVRRDGPGYAYAPSEAVGPVVDQLQAMYDTRPVTLVRAIYERPSAVARRRV